MDVTTWLLRHTPPRPLLVTVPGGTAARLAAERVVRERGWRPAAGPGEANILVVAGPGDSTVEPYVAQVWNQLPAPKARADVRTASEVLPELDAAAALLRDVETQRERAADAVREPAPNSETSHRATDAHEQTGREHANHQQQEAHGEHAGHNEQDHGSHEHHMGGAEMPGGVPMAGRAEDRDGLMLDQLTVPLGPVLPDWPAGLVLHTSMQGDVVQAASVQLLGGEGGSDGMSWWDEPWRSHPHGSHAAADDAARGLVARRLDSCARLLGLAGWCDTATTARWLRDETLSGTDAAKIGPPFRKWARRVRRSRTLRWLLADIGHISESSSTPAHLTGDALTRFRHWLASAEHAHGQLYERDPRKPERTAVARVEDRRSILDMLPDLLVGRELATVRLIVASLDPDLDAQAQRGSHHG